MIPSNIIIKAIVLSIVALVIAKALAPFIGQGLWDLFFKPPKKKNSDIDFDMLIEQKKSILRSGNPKKSESTTSKKKSKSKTEEVLHASYKKLSAKSNRDSKQEQELEELKIFMALLDSIQWGGGKEFQEIATNLTNKIGVKITENDINFHFQRLLSRDSFLNSSDKIHNLEEINDLIESKVFLEKVLKEDSVIKLLAKRFSTGEKEVKKGLSVFLKKSQRADAKNIQIKVLKSEKIELPSPDSPHLFACIKSKKGEIIKRAVLLASIKEEVEFFKTLSPLPALKGKNDIDGALKLLGLKKSATKQEVKKQYKNLAKIKHPDRLKGKGIPEEFESIATENFTRIQEAYDILDREIKDSD